MRWADLDLLGHVNNVVYVDYLQEARVDMLRVHARGPQTDRLAEGVVVVEHQVQYVAPVVFGFEPVSIETWVTEIHAASFTMAYEVFHEDDAGRRTVYLRATSVLAPYVFATERPRRLTPEEKASLADYLEPVQRPRVQIGTISHREEGHYPLQVRFSDVDVYGHVNNVKYFEYFQEARILALAKATAGLPASRPHMVVAQTDVLYKRPILFRAEAYDVWTSVARVGNRSLHMEAEITDPLAEGDPVLARGRFVLVFFDTETGASISPPDDVRELLASFA